MDKKHKKTRTKVVAGHAHLDIDAYDTLSRFVTMINPPRIERIELPAAQATRSPSPEEKPRSLVMSGLVVVTSIGETFCYKCLSDDQTRTRTVWQVSNHWVEMSLVSKCI
jgi:hypothetical protein